MRRLARRSAELGLSARGWVRLYESDAQQSTYHIVYLRPYDDARKAGLRIFRQSDCGEAMSGARVAYLRITCLGEITSTLIGPVGVSTFLCELVISMVAASNCLYDVLRRGFQAFSDL